ncbi:hypothetical protein COS53_00380 [Candidatus Shapirobacteria bacterium CG03_land_8_20_14_0_80_35_14]|uniref:Uncharacterized protein n=1 Tax=Candidatus Shapirobacteria bacterium CG03_land_8_20_14_0_80_35_14 TaxID=1974878 RepID=A0A2M7BQU6_9BACT|nr:MAG: hypothetical protein COS53_00380 [Candidatus Shapirobacteria bacterium CG03_land_8_20_14_0_80_35_14]
MKSDFKSHIIPLFVIYFATSLMWIFQKTNYLNYIYLLLGLSLGSYLLDIDHLIYWLYLKPNLEESRLAGIAWKKGDWRSLLKLLKITESQHLSLIFHHYFSQVILTIFSFFIFTSTSNIFIKSLLLAINIHLLIDEIISFKNNPKILQQWLFARETKQFALSSLKYYLYFFTVICLILTLILIF